MPPVVPSARQRVARGATHSSPSSCSQPSAYWPISAPLASETVGSWNVRKIPSVVRLAADLRRATCVIEGPGASWPPFNPLKKELNMNLKALALVAGCAVVTACGSDPTPPPQVPEAPPPVAEVPPPPPPPAVDDNPNQSNVQISED